MKHLVRKISHFMPLTDTDRDQLLALGRREEEFPHRADLVRDGERPPSLFVISSGLACRYKVLEDGRRQIISFLVPGDLCDLHVFMLGAMDHSIATLGPTRVTPLRVSQVLDLVFTHPRLNAGLWWCLLQEKAILRQRIIGLGRRDAADRLAFLLCELLWRMTAVEAVPGRQYALPLSQIDLADSLGLSAVRVNRLMQDLRDAGLIAYRPGTIRVTDPEALRRQAGFDESYLHYGNAAPEVRRYLEQLAARSAPQPPEREVHP